VARDRIIIVHLLICMILRIYPIVPDAMLQGNLGRLNLNFPHENRIVKIFKVKNFFSSVQLSIESEMDRGVIFEIVFAVFRLRLKRFWNPLKLFFKNFSVIRIKDHKQKYPTTAEF
jgi:hypothetical protein